MAFNSQAQTYSTIIKDREIITFIISIGKALKINKLNSSILELISDQMCGAKAGEPISDDSLKKYFTKRDIDFICEQYHALIQTRWWPKNFVHFKIIDSFGVKKIYETSVERFYEISMNSKKRSKDNYFYSLSIPYFSLDRKMAVIRTAFSGGFLSETECTAIYKMSAKGEWVSISRYSCYLD
jgi:hypothetical protein